MTTTALAPANALDPTYQALRSGDQNTITNQDGKLGPCQSEFINDLNSRSDVVQLAWQDASAALSMPSGFPIVDVDNIGNFYQESNYLNDDVVKLENEERNWTAAGRPGDVAILKTVENQVLAVNGQMWSQFNDEQQQQLKSTF